MNNIEYIKNWFLNNNKYLNEDPNKEEILDILVFYTIAFEKIANITDEDKIIVNNGIITCTSGPIYQNEEVQKLLKIINIKYGYYDYDTLTKTPGYTYFKKRKINGTVDKETTKTYLEKIYNSTIEYYKDYNFDKYSYKINNNIFFSINPLNENEIAQLYEINSSNQKLFEIFHDEEGKMRVY